MASLIGLIIACIVAYFVYGDAKARGMNAAGWSIGVLALMILFLPLYLIVRKPRIQNETNCNLS
jgi:uncharacterized membrane protein